MKQRDLFDLFIRYFILIFVGLFGLDLIYLIVTPLTVYPSFYLLRLFHPFVLQGTTLTLKDFTIYLTEACVAGSAYYLILVLNLSTSMSKKSRIKSLLLSFISFLILNILRIVIFGLLLVSGFTYFDLTHKIVWYLGSTILVVFVWFYSAYLSNIKNIPAYTDLKNLFNNIKKEKKRK